jgi:hypothetical protein
VWNLALWRQPWARRITDVLLARPIPIGSGTSGNVAAVTLYCLFSPGYYINGEKSPNKNVTSNRLKEVTRQLMSKISAKPDSFSSNDDSISNINYSNWPCANYYQKIKGAYRALLGNLGCICNVLLSLNLEPCCVIPSHLSKRSRTPRDVTSDKGVLTLCMPTTAVGMQTAGDWC